MIDELYQCLTSFFETSKLSRLHENYGGGKIFSNPKIGVASGDDPIFQKFKEVVGPEHLTPLELWLAEGQENLKASNIRDISIVFPFVEKIRKESKNVKELLRVILPAEIYSEGRNYANAFKKEACRHVIDFFQICIYSFLRNKIN